MKNINMSLLIIVAIVFYFIGAIHPINIEEAKYVKYVGSYITGAMALNDTANELPSPKERINASNIFVYNDRVIIKINNPKWAIFTDTNSMDPVIDKEAKAIEIDANCDDIQVGDIVSYESKIYNTVIIHRVIDIGYDDKGKYFIFKGDNNKIEDPEKVRCDQLKRVVVAIIY